MKPITIPNSVPTASNVIDHTKEWYQKRLVEGQKAGDRRYEAEIRRFQDTFERVGSLDGTARDLNHRPGEVSAKSSLFDGRVKSLLKTDQGFALCVGYEMSGLPRFGKKLKGYLKNFLAPKADFSSVEYLVDEHTGLISVTEKEVDASLHEKPWIRTKTYVLDTQKKELRDERSTLRQSSSYFGIFY